MTCERTLELADWLLAPCSLQSSRHAEHQLGLAACVAVTCHEQLELSVGWVEHCFLLTPVSVKGGASTERQFRSCLLFPWQQWSCI